MFDTKPDSVYDNDISQRYQFPKRYLSLVETCVDDWVVFRRPRADGGDLSYFATAKISKIETDKSSNSMFYTHLHGFLEFENIVPWNENGQYAEQALRDLPRAEVGVFLRGRSVRPLEDEDFNRMIAMGLPNYWNELSHEEKMPNAGNMRPVERVLISRAVRDKDFRRRVCAAYNNRCAVTGICVADSKRNFEVQAAHIWPVSDGGPDTIQNGLALTSTAHWLFDRHLISIDTNYRLLVRDDILPAELKGVLKSSGQMINLPKAESALPSTEYLAKHRARFETIKKLKIL